MFTVENYQGTMEQKYSLLNKQLNALIKDEENIIANFSNASALLNVFLKKINWVGFYFSEGETLVLGPFQGKPACIRIPFGKGVCGKAALERKTVIVDDVEQFPGHIACDAASRSEIVIPIIREEKLFAVLDIDSPEINRFSEEEAKYLHDFVKILENHLCS